MKPTFLRVGVPKTKTRAIGTVRPPTESPTAATPASGDWKFTDGAAGTSHTSNFPSGAFAAGDYILLVVAIASSASPISGLTGYTQLTTVTGGGYEWSIYGKVAVGGEEDGTVGFTTSGATTGRVWIGRLDGAGQDFSSNAPNVGSMVTAAGGQPNPPQVSAETASASHYVIAGYMSDDSASAPSSTAPPSGYTYLTHAEVGGPDQKTEIAYALKTISSTEDPAAGWDSMSGTRNWCAWTVAYLQADGTAELATGDHTHDDDTLTSDGANDGDVLTSDGAGGVAWEAPGGGDHGALTGLSDDDHTQYSLADGTRAFTGTVGGVTPSASSDLATKGYVDSNAGEYWEVIVSGSAPPVAVSTEDDDDWVYGLVP